MKNENSIGYLLLIILHLGLETEHTKILHYATTVYSTLVPHYYFFRPFSALLTAIVSMFPTVYHNVFKSLALPNVHNKA